MSTSTDKGQMGYYAVGKCKAERSGGEAGEAEAGVAGLACQAVRLSLVLELMGATVGGEGGSHP